MMNGYTANEARNRAIGEYVLLTNSDPVDEYQQPIIRVWGDYNTRISGVYTGTGSDSPMIDWFTSIVN